MNRHRIIIVDDHPLFRDALRQALATGMDGLEILEAGGLEELTNLLAGAPDIDLVLLDLSMPGVRSYSGLMYLRAQHPELPVVVVSAAEEPSTIRRCLEFGASGYVPKSLPVDQIRSAIEHVLKGEVWSPPDVDLNATDDGEADQLVAKLSTLTPQQVRVLMMLGEGLLNKQIAYELGVSEATVKAHVSAILQKLGVDSRTQAVIAVNKIESGEWQKIAG
ncbi:MAG: response regulator transcription factor [Hyphomicrobiaceae bacterium]